MDLYEEIVRLRAAGAPAALCTVLLARGSTPGKETMKMLVRADGTTLGSIGGGCVEEDCRRLALEVIAEDRAATRTFHLNQKDLPESGLICGGQVTVLVEPVVPPTLVLFGGGHVAGSAVRVARECGWRTVVCDDRREYADPAKHPLADRCLAGPWADAVAGLAPAEHLWMVVATRGHTDDLAVLRELAARECRPRYLGLLGSRAKKATLERILADEGVDPDFIARIRTPIGLPIGSRTAGEIAVSLMAELVRIRRLGEKGGLERDPAGDKSGVREPEPR
ncbi:MAG: xanthine dehydrogenase [Planctomycetota bacterium]|nr:MAG: xanthine dehydrogenase [Planctomycetota bacterium]